MTTSKSKAKGTGGEREVLHILREFWPTLRRTPAAHRWDLQAVGDEEVEVLHILATRTDRGRWLYTVDGETLSALVHPKTRVPDVRVEVKRYKKMQIHTIFEEKFGGSLGRSKLRREQEIEEAINRGD